MNMPDLRSALCLVGVLGGLALSPAHGASFDCKHAATDGENAVCADPKLSSLDDELARRYAAALAQSLYPAPLRVEQSEWLARVRRLKGPEDIATAYTARLETLGILLASPDAAAAKRVVALSDARAACLDAFAEPIAAAPCKLTEFKNVATLDGVSFAYASYAFQTADGSILGGRTAIFERLDADHLRVLFVPENDGGIFYTSTVIRTGGGILLHLPGTESGTGNFNRERLFVWSDRHWRGGCRRVCAP
jgi:uncharacterized protein